MCFYLTKNYTCGTILVLLLEGGFRLCRERRTVNTILSIYKVDAGCTCPVLVKLDNESRAVLKYPRNPQGMVVLLNEYITGHLAKVIGLTTPNFGIAVVDDNTTLDTNLSVFIASIFPKRHLCLLAL